jgi:hypothetical protein
LGKRVKMMSGVRTKVEITAAVSLSARFRAGRWSTKRIPISQLDSIVEIAVIKSNSLLNIESLLPRLRSHLLERWQMANKTTVVLIGCIVKRLCVGWLE